MSYISNGTGSDITISITSFGKPILDIFSITINPGEVRLFIPGITYSIASSHPFEINDPRGNRHYSTIVSTTSGLKFRILIDAVIGIYSITSGGSISAKNMKLFLHHLNRFN